MTNFKNISRKIFLHDLDILCSIGVYEDEHLNPQKIIINAELIINLRNAPSNDSIEETLNYDLIYSGIKRIVSSKHFNLIETLTHSIFYFLLELPYTEAARVSVSKPDIYPDCLEVGFEISNL